MSNKYITVTNNNDSHQEFKLKLAELFGEYNQYGNINITVSKGRDPVKNPFPSPITDFSFYLSPDLSKK